MVNAARLVIGRHLTAAAVCLVLASCVAPRAWDNDPATHIVRKGETLFSIAWRYNKSVPELARWNQLGNGSLIYPGQVIRLSGPASTTARSGSTSRPTASGTAGGRATRPLPTIPSAPMPSWAWPTNGKVTVRFGQKPGTGTGILIDGKSGQTIVAASSGRVMYAGTGLIGYGKLVVIKHNDTYLSAYGYTATLLVKEGDTVKKGAKIATMGEGPERKARLHFEIRKNGQPVDPQLYLSR